MNLGKELATWSSLYAEVAKQTEPQLWQEWPLGQAGKGPLSPTAAVSVLGCSQSCILPLNPQPSPCSPCNASCSWGIPARTHPALRTALTLGCSCSCPALGEAQGSGRRVPGQSRLQRGTRASQRGALRPAPTEHSPSVGSSRPHKAFAAAPDRAAPKLQGHFPPRIRKSHQGTSRNVLLMHLLT